jgi:hypothetical protein
VNQLSQHLFGKLFQQLTDRLPFERSISYLAGMVIAVAEYPRLADRPTRSWSGEQFRQTPASPKPVLIDRFEA